VPTPARLWYRGRQRAVRLRPALIAYTEVGFTPTVHEGTVETSAAAGLIAQGCRLYCVPSSCISALPETTWRPLTEPASYYPWSVLWRATRHLRPRAGHRQLRANHVPATRLARRSKAAGALTGPDPVRPVVTPLRRAVTHSPFGVKVPFAHGLEGAGRSAVDASAKIMPTL
jgi:hypothetical protein